MRALADSVLRGTTPAPPTPLSTGNWRRSSGGVDRKAGVLRLEVGTTKTKKGWTLKYAAIVELRAAIDAQWTAHEALRKQGTICPWAQA